MQYITPYALLLIALSMMQVLLFDRIYIDPHFTPIVYIAFITLLPMQFNRLGLMLAGGLMGIVVDWLSGTSGLSTIMMLAMGYLRPLIMRLSLNDEALMSNSIPSGWSLGWYSMVKYTILMSTIACTILFITESLNIDLWLYIAIKSVVSGLASAIFTIIISALFNPLLDNNR